MWAREHASVYRYVELARHGLRWHERGIVMNCLQRLLQQRGTAPGKVRRVGKRVQRLGTEDRKASKHKRPIAVATAAHKACHPQLVLHAA